MTRLRVATAWQARLRSFHLRASRYGGQVAATARQARNFRTCAAAAKQARVRVGAGLAALAVLIGGNSSVFACPMCFGAEETSMVDATKLGVLVMLAIVIAVQGAFVGFFFYLRKRAKRIAEIELDTEWSQLQGVSRT
jgi:hypothetical protein